MANYYDREHQSSPIRRGAGYRSAFDRYSGYEPDEPYFGSGRQSYGEGYTDTPRREYGSWSSDYDTYRDVPVRRRYSDRAYERGYGEREPSYGERSYIDRTGYGRYGAPYPESERGYYSGREPYRGADRGWWDRTSDEISSWFGDEEAARRREMDERRHLRGLGPKNYTRSDERIRDDINDRLTESSFVDASEIEVAVNDHEVTLTGLVESRFEKRVAEDIADDVTGVSNVENKIRVSPVHVPQSSSAYSAEASQSKSTGR